MFVSFARLWRDREGVSAVEFALMLPVLLLITAGMIDLGRALYQTNVIEKGLRAGAMYAARNDFPLTTSQQTEAQNIVKKGNRDGAGSYLVSGWSDSTSLSIFTTTEIVDGTPLPVYHFVAAVPFDPLLPGLLSALNLDDIKIRLAHEQAYIGY
jgi:Flp pilus assembly protein TadG